MVLLLYNLSEVNGKYLRVPFSFHLQNANDSENTQGIFFFWTRELMTTFHISNLDIQNLLFNFCWVDTSHFCRSWAFWRVERRIWGYM